MDRREFVIGSIVFSPAVESLRPPSPSDSILTVGSPGTGSNIPAEGGKPKRNDAEYEICRRRGHRAATVAIEGNAVIGVNHSVFNQAHSVYRRPDTAETTPGYVKEGPWQTCYDCGREFRLVATLEEQLSVSSVTRESFNESISTRMPVDGSGYAPRITSLQAEQEKATQQARELEYCRQRGHVDDPNVLFGRPNYLPTPNRYQRSAPELKTQPGYVTDPSWKSCYFCGQEFRLVTRLEER